MLYRKYIRPMHCYPGQHYEPLTEPVEKEERWYPEEEREHLENKYGYLNKGSFSDLVFEEKYEPYSAFCKDCEWYDERISLCDNCGLPREQTFFCADGRQKVKRMVNQNDENVLRSMQKRT